jgi:deoxyadenosine/deoxycytidine kinase
LKFKIINPSSISVYYLEGGVGVGKSSILENIKNKHPEINVFPEPLLDYQRFCGGEPLLDFYSELPGSAFRFQLLALSANYENYERTFHRASKCLVERSIYSSFNVFTRTLYDLGDLSAVEHGIVTRIYKILEGNCNRVIIYLKADPLICMKRIRERGRGEEIEMTIDYLRHLDNSHEKFIHDCRNTAGTIVYEVDASQELSLVSERVCEILMA